MSFRRDLPFWQVPLSQFQAFDHGEIIECTMLASLNLKLGDVLEYEAGVAISGLAEVVSVGAEQVPWWDDELNKAPGVECKFKKIS